jgi:glutaredoxin
MIEIEIHSKTACPFCTMAKQHLARLGVPFNETVHDDFEDRQELYDQLGLVNPKRTVPQMFLIDGNIREYIGGYTDLMESDLTTRIQVEKFDADF